MSAWQDGFGVGLAIGLPAGMLAAAVTAWVVASLFSGRLAPVCRGAVGGALAVAMVGVWHAPIWAVVLFIPAWALIVETIATAWRVRGQRPVVRREPGVRAG